MAQLDQGSDVTVLQDQIFAFACSLDDSIHHAASQIIGTDHLIGNQQPEHGIDCAQQAIAEVWFFAGLHGIDVSGTEDDHARKTRREQCVLGLALVTCESDPAFSSRVRSAAAQEGRRPAGRWNRIYATEGTPLIVGPNGIFKQAPNPNAARLFQSFCFTPEAQQLIIDYGGMRSEHLQTKEKPGRKPFREIKVMKEDAVSVERMSEEIKARYTKVPCLRAIRAPRGAPETDITPETVLSFRSRILNWGNMRTKIFENVEPRKAVLVALSRIDTEHRGKWRYSSWRLD
jgi:hypothetical protein